MTNTALVRLQVICWLYESGDRGFELRDSIGPWESCHVVKNDDDTYSVLSPNKDYWLSIQPDGSMEVRTSSNHPGPWEKFTRDGSILIELPKEGITTPPHKFALVTQLD